MSEHRKLISLEEVAVAYRTSRSLFNRQSYQALKSVSFDLHAGDSLGVIGRNGAGKSTLLRIIGGIITPDAGRYTNFNATTSLLSLQAGFDMHFSGRTNALLSGMLLGFNREQVDALLPSIIAFAELGDFIDMPVKTYSTGMMARLGFSIANKLSPDILCIDEVLGVGDIEFRRKSSQVVREKLMSDQTVVLVSHQGDVIRSLCTRAVWIEDGISRICGEPEEVVTAYEDYLCRPVAG